MKKLNIFVDETGEFGFGNESSELYGISFTFHEQDIDIMPQINKLNSRLEKLGYTKMIHMADLIMRRGEIIEALIFQRERVFLIQYISSPEEYQ